MANEIKAKFSSMFALTSAFGAVANGAAKQTAFFDNSATRYQTVFFFVKLKLGTAPTAEKFSEIFLLSDDANGHITDEGVAGVGAITILNARFIGILHNGPAPATGKLLLSSALIVQDPGPKFAIAIRNGSGVAFDANDANHYVRLIGVNPEVA